MRKNANRKEIPSTIKLESASTYILTSCSSCVMEMRFKRCMIPPANMIAFLMASEYIKRGRWRERERERDRKRKREGEGERGERGEIGEI